MSDLHSRLDYQYGSQQSNNINNTYIPNMEAAPSGLVATLDKVGVCLFLFVLFLLTGVADAYGQPKVNKVFRMSSHASRAVYWARSRDMAAKQNAGIISFYFWNALFPESLVTKINTYGFILFLFLFIVEFI